MRRVDFGARQFDSQIGRSPVQDVLQERYPNEPAYVFAGNNPVYFTDAGGLFRIDPVTARDYPFLAKMIQYYLPLLKDNPIIRASFKRTGMTDEQFDEMVTYGTGSWITATRPDETNWQRMGDPLYTNIGSIHNGIYDDGAYRDNLFLSRDKAWDLEQAAAKMLKTRNRGNKASASSLSQEVGFEMFFVSLAVLHEVAHRLVFIVNGARKASVLEGRDEQGALWEGRAYERFSYKNNIFKGMDKGEVKQYYNKDITRYNGTGMTWSWDNWYNIWALSQPATSGQSGDPAIKKNNVKPSTGSPQDDKW